MPSRIAQTLCTALFLIILFLIDKTTEKSLWILIPAGILAAASFAMGDLINSIYYSKYSPSLNAYELHWVQRFVPFYKNLDEATKEKFCDQLALEMREKDFTSMAEKDLPEELKMMVMTPAVRLKLFYKDKSVAHYNKIIFYHHAFASPDQQYLHLSETQHEDGVIILSSDALEASYLNPANYFNTALYEWSCIFVKLKNLAAAISIEETNAWEVINALLSTDTKTLLDYLGQTKADHYALLCYCYVMYPEHLKIKLPDFYKHLRNIIG